MDKNINNVKNYFKTIKTQEKKICFIYFELIKRFLLYFQENEIVETLYNKKYVLLNGINMLKHVFTQLILYTKNTDLTYYHSEISYHYYIEFISQINDKSFLYLNSKDALLFIYRKTIFQIDETYRKTFTLNKNERTIFNKLFDDCNNISVIIQNIINLYDCNCDNNIIQEIKEKEVIKFKDLVQLIDNTEIENIFEYDNYIELLQSNYDIIKYMLCEDRNMIDVKNKLIKLNRNGIIP